jgi:hypothetical protein
LRYAPSRAGVIPTGRFLLTRQLIATGALALVAGAAATTLFTGSSRGADTHQADLARAQAQTAALRAQLTAERRRHQKALARARTGRITPSVEHALTIASAAYGVPKAKLHRVAVCESTLNPKATNGQYVGLFQFGPTLWSASPYGRLTRTDPYAAALAAAWAFSKGKGGQWPVCGRR